MLFVKSLNLLVLFLLFSNVFTKKATIDVLLARNLTFQ
jgi:hypothetical protein